MTAGTTRPTGYADPAYAATLAHVGAPRLLPGSGGSILVRPIPGTAHADGRGAYPLFSCRDWSALAHDLDHVGGDLVSLVVVADPFGDCTLPQLRAAFPDRCVAFKEHFVVDLTRPPIAAASRHHRRDAARALRRTTVSRVEDGADFGDAWCALYGGLVAQRGIRGPAAFPSESLRLQLRLSGAVTFRASDAKDRLLGAAVWLVNGPVAYYHLAASTPEGHAAGASYALMATSLEHFASSGLEFALLGAGAGATPVRDDGLIRFKEGWASGTRTAYLCGRVFDRSRYDALAGERHTPYFPAYRAGDEV